MKKALLFSLLAVILVAGLFILTGCGDEKTETSNDGQAPVDTSNQLVQATEFYIQNSLPNDTRVREIYATVSGLDAWTPNLVAGLELAPGTRAKIGLGITETTTTWDIKAVDQEGTAVTFPSIDLSSLLSKTAETVDLTIIDGELVAAVK